MSSGYGNRRGRRGGGRRFGNGSRWDGGAGRGGEPRSSECDFRDHHGGGRERPPAHLKGREIGMWYARRGGMRKAEAERNSRAVVQMDAAREQNITRLLSSVQRGSHRDSMPSTSQNWRAKEVPSSHSYFDGDLPEAWTDNPRLIKTETPKETKELVASVKAGLDDKDLGYAGHSLERQPSVDDELKKDVQKKTENRRYVDMLQFREKLPSYEMKEELVRLIAANQVLVISGETGCGKTTQVTQFILDDYIKKGMGSVCRVVCTQPRRISAISVAERVAAERAESVGNGNSCGYQIRLQRKPKKTF